MNGGNLLGPVVILLAVAAVLGVCLRRLRQNALVGYLLAGVLLGPTGLKLIREGSELRELSEIGVALLLFSIGLEFSFSRLRQIGRVATLGGLAQLVLTLSTVAALMLAAGRQLAEAIVVGAALSVSSTAVVLRVLMDRAEMDSPHGRTAIGILLLQDAAVIPLLLMTEALAGSLGGSEALARFGLRTLAAAGAAGLLWLTMRYAAPALFARALLSGNRELPVVVAASASLGAAVGASAIGLSPALGAFVAGVVLAESPFATQIRADVTPLTAVFIATFFASMGTVVQLPGGKDLAGVFLAAASLLLLKAIIAGGVVWAFQRSVRTALGAGLALSQVGEFTFVLADVGFRRGLLNGDRFEFLVAVSLVTLIATPYVIGFSAGLSTWVRRRMPVRQRRGLEAPGPKGRWDRVIVIGYGPAGQQVVTALERTGTRFLVVEFNPCTVTAYGASLPIELGDATQPEVLRHIGVGHCRAVVVTVPDPMTSRVIVEQVARLAPGVPVVARARYHQYARMLEYSGASSTVDEEQIVGAEIAKEVLWRLGGQGDQRQGA